MRSNEYEALALALAPRRVLYFDNPCVGDGPRPDGPLTILDQARHQWGQIRQAVGDVPVHLFGLSMGGMIASTMASMLPQRVLSLTVAATSPNVAPSAEAIPALLEEAWLKIRSPEDLAGAVDIAFGKTTKQMRPEIRDWYINYRATGRNLQKHSDFAKQLSAIRKFNGDGVYPECRRHGFRALVVAGEEDELFPAAHSELIGSLLGARVETLSKVGHMLHLEAPTELAACVSKFLDGVERSGI